jgi:hypothetical protein
VTTEPESGTPEPLRGLGPDDPRFWDAFVVVSEEKIGNVTLRRMELAPGHPGIDGNLHISFLPDPEGDTSPGP